MPTPQVQSNQVGLEVLFFPIQPPAVNVGQLGLEVLFHPLPPPQIDMNQCGLEVLFPYRSQAVVSVYTITTMPSSPGPSNIIVNLCSNTSSTESGFSGQTQVGLWETQYTEVTILMPPLVQTADQANWIGWLAQTCKAQGVFQLQTEIEEQIPSNYSTTWWRLMPEPVQIEWEVGGIVQITFKICSLSKYDVSLMS